jgi:hypothetical protein
VRVAYKTVGGGGGLNGGLIKSKGNKKLQRRVNFIFSEKTS